MADTRTTVALQPAVPPSRPEYLRDVVASGDIGVVQKPLTLWERLVNQAWLRKAFILVVIAVAWQLYARELNNPLLLPTFTATIDAFSTAMINGDLPQKVANSVQAAAEGLCHRARRWPCCSPRSRSRRGSAPICSRR